MYSVPMPKLILTCAVLALLFCLLCGPVFYVAFRFWQGGDGAALRPLRLVWVVQLALAAAFVFLADDAGLGNPVGVILGIVMMVSLLSAALFGMWRLALRIMVR